MTKNKKITIGLFLALTFLLPVSAQSAVVTFVSGKVETSTPAGWTAVKVGDTLNASDTISTGFQSEAKIEYNGSIMALGALTRITIDTLAATASKDNVSVFLSTGAVRSKVNHTENKRVSYSVKTPIAVASVRGTDFIVTAGGTVSCLEGAVAVYANREKSRGSGEKKDSVKESEEENDKTEETTDYESATALTSAEDIDSKAPVGAVVVGKNQEVSFTLTGRPETPMINAVKKSEKVVNTVTTAAEQESMAIGALSAVASEVKINEQETEVVQSASIVTTIVLED